MKWSALLLLAAFSIQAPAALAQPAGPHRDFRGGPPPGRDMTRREFDRPRPDGPQQGDRGGFRRDDMDQRRGQAMSPEERRQLRRDISDHGRDVYRDPQRQ